MNHAILESDASAILTGFAAWESPGPFEDVHAPIKSTGESNPIRGQIMLETTLNSTKITWHTACAFDDLSIGAGTCVLIEGEQVAHPLPPTQLTPPRSSRW